MPGAPRRVRVALRHRRALAAVVDDDGIEVGSLHLDVAAHDAWLDGRPLDLAPQGVRAADPARPQRRQGADARALLAERLGRSGRRRTPSRCGPAVTTLRKKLGAGPGRPVLVTEPGVGYRLLAGRLS